MVLEIVNYLNVAFNLNDGTYRPYQKPDNIIQYMMSNLTTLQILNKFRKQSKNASPSSPPMKKYSMNQHDSMKINYTNWLPTKIKLRPC